MKVYNSVSKNVKARGAWKVNLTKNALIAKMAVIFRPPVHGGMLMRKIQLAQIFFLIAAALIVGSGGLFGQGAQEQEMRAESSLTQADELYSRGEYQKAIESYLQVVETSRRNLNLSRAHMGLSLCYFYLENLEKAKVEILKTLEIDPKKEVSSLFYPQSYVDLFNQVREENKDRLAALAAAKAQEPKVEAPQAEARPAQASVVEAPGTGEKIAGRFEVEFHFGAWSISPAKGLMEETLTKKAANEIRDHLTDTLNDQYGGNLVRSAYQQGLTLGSGGAHYGFEIRYYPLGRPGALSIGFSLDKTQVKVTMKGPVTQQYADGSSATVESDAAIETRPLTAGLNFRWDFFRSWRVIPFFTFGIGIGPLDGEARYTYSGTYTRGGVSSSVSGGETKTFDEMRQEGEFDLDVLILLHLGLGARGEVARGVFLKGEIGFWDGLIFRAGVAYRF